MPTYIAPALRLSPFTCPICATVAQQVWSYRVAHWPYQTGHPEPVPMDMCRCMACDVVSFWSSETQLQVHPRVTAAPMPHPDLPESAASDYLEARQVASESPRAAAALLRLCVQKLLPVLGGKGRNINEDIGLLVTKGLPGQVKDALDICRVVGNNAVHPGELDVRDDSELVSQLFVLINYIVGQTIEREKALAELMSKLPSGTVDAISKRDARALLSASPLPSA